MKGIARLLHLLETKAKAEAWKSLYRASGLPSNITASTKFVIKLWGSFISRKTLLTQNSSERSVLSIPFHFPTESVPSGVISKLIAKLQGCSWKRFTFNPKSSLSNHYRGRCFQLVLDDESRVRFKGMLFLSGYLESILLCLELLRAEDKIGIQAHRNQMHF